MSAGFLDRDQSYYRTIRLLPSGHFYETASEAPEMPLGQSRVGGPVIDLPEGFEHPEKMFFVAQLDLAWLSPCDRGEMLPDNEGFLYFFFNFDADKGAACRVHYFPGPARQLRRTIRPHEGWFWGGTTLTACAAEEEVIEEHYRPDGRWDYFAGMNKTKIGGYPSHPQWGEREVAQALDGDAKFVLLQVGEDITEGGCLCFFIDKGDCYHRRFDRCEAVWGQT